LLALLETISAKVRLFRAPEFLGTAFLLGVLGMLIHFLLERSEMSRDKGAPHMSLTYHLQIVNLLAALLLLISFAMLSQRRIVGLITLFAWQGAALAVDRDGRLVDRQHHLYYSAALTLGLKVIAMPWFFYRLVKKLDVDRDVEPMINIPTTMLIGIVLVIFAFNLACRSRRCPAR
jgi:D-alanyl-lipoteichoic acid acyltransferase DltB (MBOAT superfamily)